jgi:hypothetical protein
MNPEINDHPKCMDSSKTTNTPNRKRTEKLKNENTIPEIENVFDLNSDNDSLKSISF